MQKILVVTERIKSVEGRLFAIDEKVDFSFPVVVGKSGMSSEKVEGDGKTPIGSFTLLTLFGKAATNPNSKMDYIQTDESLLCVDDPNSKFYNQFVRKDQQDADFDSAEKMDQELYDLGIVTAYNTDPVIRDKGSCIFIHQWRSAAEGTEGCVAMSRENLFHLIQWLDRSKKPTLITFSLIV